MTDEIETMKKRIEVLENELTSLRKTLIYHFNVPGFNIGTQIKSDQEVWGLGWVPQHHEFDLENEK